MVSLWRKLDNKKRRPADRRYLKLNENLSLNEQNLSAHFGQIKQLLDMFIIKTNAAV